MTADSAEPSCDVCGGPGATARDTPLGTLACDKCWQNACQEPEPEDGPAPPPIGEVLQALADGHAPEDPRDPGHSVCRQCGAKAQWHPTINGKSVLIEPGTFPTDRVPRGKRWVIMGDGTARNLGQANPSDRCRITHWLACPYGENPAVAARLLPLRHLAN